MLRNYFTFMWECLDNISLQCWEDPDDVTSWGWNTFHSKQEVWMWEFSVCKFGHPALLVTIGHLCMFCNAIGHLLFICDPFLMFGLFADFPWLCRLSGQPFSLPQWFTDLVNPHCFWFQVLVFALRCFTEGSSKPWNPSMLHFFLWSLYHATGFVSPWIAGNIYIYLSESIPKVWRSVRPRHPGHRCTTLSEILQWSSKSEELVVEEWGHSLSLHSKIWAVCCSL